MDFSQLLFGVFSGDMGALSVLFVMLIPFVLVYAGIKAVWDRITTKEKK